MRPIAWNALGGLALLVMLAALWLSSPELPRPAVSPEAPPAAAREIMEGEVTGVQRVTRDDALAGPGGAAARLLTVRVTRGAQAGREVRIEIQESGVVSIPAAARQYAPGDDVVLAYTPAGVGAMAGVPAAAAADALAATGTTDAGTYELVDHRRWPWLLWGAVVFAGGIAAVAGKQGLRALVALGSAVCVLWWFIIPRLLTGAPPVQVALVGCGLIAVPSLLLTHGPGRAGLVPLMGIGSSLALVGTFTVVAVRLADLSGFGISEEVNLLYAGTGGAVDPRGLLLAGMLIGVVGGLVDVTVAQAATVFEFHAADPYTTRAELFRRGMAIGKTHVAAAVHTLVLAYAGAALPMLLLFAMYASLLDTVWNREMIVAELLRAIAGSLGLAAAMPITTTLAALSCNPAYRRRFREAPTTMAATEAAEAQPVRYADDKVGV